MAKYELVALEEYSSVYEVEANSYEEARERLETEVNLGELVLGENPYSYTRKWKNNYSKILKSPLKMEINYNPKNDKLTISHNNNTAEYSCVDVSDLIYDISLYCRNFLEDREITKDAIKNNKIALRNNLNFFPVNINNIDFFDRLIKTNDKVKINDNELLDVYCATDYDTVLMINDFFCNNIGYSIEDYIVNDITELGI